MRDTNAAPHGVRQHAAQLERHRVSASGRPTTVAGPARRRRRTVHGPRRLGRHPPRRHRRGRAVSLRMYVVAGSLDCALCSGSPALRRGGRLAGPVVQPVAIVRPPAPGPDIGRLHPGAAPRLGVGADTVGGPALGGGRVDQRLDVSAGRQHEPPRATEQLGASVRVFPWHDVIVQPGNRVAIPGRSTRGRSACRAPRPRPGG